MWCSGVSQRDQPCGAEHCQCLHEDVEPAGVLHVCSVVHVLVYSPHVRRVGWRGDALGCRSRLAGAPRPTSPVFGVCWFWVGLAAWRGGVTHPLASVTHQCVARFSGTVDTECFSYMRDPVPGRRQHFQTKSRGNVHGYPAN